jgi:hypothetical protein
MKIVIIIFSGDLTSSVAIAASAIVELVAGALIVEES